jgi:hypothetical protein
MGASLITNAAITPAPQSFRQEGALRFGPLEGAPTGKVQLLDFGTDGCLRALAEGQWFEEKAGRWHAVSALQQQDEARFVYDDGSGGALSVAVPWREVNQLLRRGRETWLATPVDPYRVVDGEARTVGWPSRYRVNQIALGSDGTLWVASSAGLYRRVENGWSPVGIVDEAGRGWAMRDVRGVAVDAEQRLWVATPAGVACQTSSGWKFYSGKDGLPVSDFTGITPGRDGEMWFSTRLGVIRFDGRDWHYRQGLRWLPHDEVSQIVADNQGDAWLATAGGVGKIERQPMTLAKKAEFFENEIEQYIKRTPFGYVAEAALRNVADKSSANPQDSDNDGLWTGMYGAGEAFAYAATRDPKAKGRAQRAFEALRFLQKVTQGGSNTPPKGYVARTIRPIEWPDPNKGRIEADRAHQKNDSLWKIYEPRWPKSADGRWYWKSDTSSDELDGHYFLYGLYFEFCAESASEKDRVREVVRDLTDHLLSHRYVLMDHDGRPTRWAIYDPEHLNRDPSWWMERGLNSLSILSYLAVAARVTGDAKYEAASRELIDRHGYAQNLMYPKLQHGPGSGNQSDDEMAFMCYYSLLRYSSDEPLKAQVRFSFFRYWANEAPEMNPFFHFAYAAHNLQAKTTLAYGTYSIGPWDGWHADSMSTLYGFPLDRLNWSHRNSHRLDVQLLPAQQAADIYEPGQRSRGHRVNGRVLPVENRHFNHWNTDPWQLDYGGHGNELASGTVFLLPYYLGIYHGFVERPSAP